VSKQLFPAVLAVLALLGAGAARADTIIFREGALLPGGGTYGGTLDTEIQGADPTGAFGTDVSMRADADFGGSAVQSLLYFGNLFGALPDQIPLGSTITSAVLTVVVTNFSDSPVGNIAVYEMTTSWSESSTWNSLGAGVQPGSETVTVADDTHAVTANGPTTFDVLASLQDWASGGTNLGWVIVNDSTDGLQLITSEYLVTADRPSLEVEFTPIPEPGSFALAGLAGAAALCLRRARRS
jgi:hypothetical protein